MSNSESLGEFSRSIAAILGEQNGRSVTKVTAEFAADFIQWLTGRRPSRDTMEVWVHVGMLGAAVYVLSRR